MKGNKFKDLWTLILLCGSISMSLFAQKEAKVWKTFKKDSKRGVKSVLVDYSRAGYAFGEKEIPDVAQLNYPYFNIIDFGAIPNDTIADDEAIHAAIRAAEEAKRGVVFLPKGRYVVCKGVRYKGFEVNHSNIVIKGEGAGPGGTEIFMQDYMRHDKAVFKWIGPHMFTFRPEGLDYDAFCSTNTASRPYKITSPITKFSSEGSYEIEVKDASQFVGLTHIVLVMPYNKECVKDFLGDVPTRPQWERINNKGITANEIHKIKAIKGNTIVFEHPLLTDVKPKFGWYVAPHEVISECGFEDIHLIGNFQEKFVHHKNKIHDSGWKGVNMAHVSNGWIRRCVFTNVNYAARVTGSISSSVVMNIIDGKQGHGSVEMTFGTRNFTGLWLDKTDYGQWHGIDASHMAAGNVAWRIFAPQGRGFDLHSGYTRATLYDCYEGYNMTGNGGNYKVEPHHMKGFTLWNFKQTGPAVKGYDYWSMKPKKENVNSKYWGFAVAKPVVVGFHGSETTFVASSIGYKESLGKKVVPESLYEAQLEYRLGKRPLWLDNILKEWKDWRRVVLSEYVN
ncbi:DUF4955 domain-containing protein [Seonamhaeicola marinus]|uniref:DUF4955 domain-containing protein n=1 Tax=Seonamhaeicola marinus TaxID=1912246 RepID=A0A5D0HUX9_9FLAO|nr:DUF4955 domain-containing protein [Seonamhaeicola marinus]TYA74670.1 DUF4955 domain-containing protein [Seonamhaeicola marinus]